jgi:hypothetical protein
MKAALLLCAALSLAACGASNDCKFDFEDIVSPDATPWICQGQAGTSLSIVFNFDGTGTRSDGGPFQWQTTSCRSVFLDPTAPGGIAANLIELGGRINEIGRFTFVLGTETFLCGYGVPPPTS